MTTSQTEIVTAADIERLQSAVTEARNRGEYLGWPPRTGRALDQAKAALKHARTLFNRQERQQKREAR